MREIGTLFEMDGHFNQQIQHVTDHVKEQGPKTGKNTLKILEDMKVERLPPSRFFAT
jgi:hypothetical protein